MTVDVRLQRASGTDRPRDGLTARTVRGILLLAGRQGSALVLQVAALVVLVRFLVPDDFGIVAMAAAFVPLLTAIADVGTSTIVVQRDRVTDEEINALFWVNTCVTIVLAVGFAGSGHLLAGFYARPEVAAITPWLAGAFLIGGLGNLHRGLLTRRLRFSSLASADLVAMTVATAAAVAVAVAGARWWALVVQQAVASTVATALLWRASGWRPARPARPTGLRSLFVDGGSITTSKLVDALSGQIDNILVGRWLGGAALGLYGRGYRLFKLSADHLAAPASQVMTSMLCGLRHEPDRFRSAYRRALRGLAYVVFPASVAVIFAADPLVLLLLGDGWQQVADVLRILVVAMPALVIATSNGWLYVATNHLRRQAVWALISRAVLIAGLAMGVRWGITGVAVAHTLVLGGLLPVSFLVATRGTPVRVHDVVASCWRPALGALLLGAVLLLAGRMAAATGAEVLVAALAFGTASIAMITVWWSARHDVRDLALALRPG